MNQTTDSFSEYVYSEYNLSEFVPKEWFTATIDGLNPTENNILFFSNGVAIIDLRLKEVYSQYIFNKLK